jgi:hypothetical protein
MGHGAVLLYNGTGGSNAEIFLKNGRNCKKKITCAVFLPWWAVSLLLIIFRKASIGVSQPKRQNKGEKYVGGIVFDEVQ